MEFENFKSPAVAFSVITAIIGIICVFMTWFTVNAFFASVAYSGFDFGAGILYLILCVAMLLISAIHIRQNLTILRTGLPILFAVACVYLAGQSYSYITDYYADVPVIINDETGFYVAMLVVPLLMFISGIASLISNRKNKSVSEVKTEQPSVVEIKPGTAYCRRCGQVIGEMDLFCQHCGSKAIETALQEEERTS